MVKRMKVPSIFSSRKDRASSWKWQPFEHLKSISLRYKDNMFKSPRSGLSNAVMTSSSCSSLSKSLSAVVDHENGGELVDMAVKALTSKRFFFLSRGVELFNRSKRVFIPPGVCGGSNRIQ
jgi:hypothetical protein